jgi:threonine/homoserine/homoserine lactone efflux protein
LGVACALTPTAVAAATSPGPPLMLGLTRVGSARVRHGSAAGLGLTLFALFGTLHRRSLLSPGSLAPLRPLFAL